MSKKRQCSKCIEWGGAVSPEGYGRIGPKYVHRMVYIDHYGPIPTGMQVDHLCRNRRCVNPEHLEAVTQRENILRGNSACAINARKVTCLRGHKFDGIRKTANGVGRTCSKCQRLREKRSLA